MNNKPKVAYLSWLGTNYGSTLQGIALYKSIEKLGYDCEIVGASGFHKWTKPDISLKSHDPKKYDHDLMGYNFTVFMEKILDFADELDKIHSNGHLSPSQIEASVQYSAFVCGSDQVWKPFTFWFTAKQYLVFADSDKTIGYAPSVGWKEIPPKASANIPQWKKWLSHVRYLSARDVPSSKLLNQVTGRDVTTVIDPTLLLTPKEWLGVLPSPKYSQEITEVLNSGKPYLMAYLLDTSPEKENIVARLLQKLGLEEVVWLTGRSNTGAVQRNCAETDPSGFVHLISEASFVVADGFHGCCFAINFSKPFIFLTKKAEPSNDSRIEDLHGRMGIHGRIVTTSSDLDAIDLTMNFEKTVQILQGERVKSLEYLQNSLKGAADAPRKVVSVHKDNHRTHAQKHDNLIKHKDYSFHKITIDISKVDYDSEHWRSVDNTSKNIAFATVSFHEPRGCFLRLKLTDGLIANGKYQFDGKVHIDSDSAAVSIHIGNVNTEHPEIIKTISDVQSGKWQKLSFEFSPKMQNADCLIFGASQFSGRNGCLELSEVAITRKDVAVPQAKISVTETKKSVTETKKSIAKAKKSDAKTKKPIAKAGKSSVIGKEISIGQNFERSIRPIEREITGEVGDETFNQESLESVLTSEKELTPDVDNCKTIVLLLKEYGVKHAVISSSTRDVHLAAFFECNKYFNVHNVEDGLSAAFYAIGISSKLRQPVVCCCTSGSSVPNYLPAIAESYNQHIPLICLVVDRYSYILNQREHRTIPQSSMYGGIVKKFFQLPVQMNSRDAVCRRMVSEAIVSAVSGIPGPVLINVPISNMKVYKREAYDLSGESITPVWYADYWHEDRWFDALKEIVNYKRILVIYGQNSTISHEESNQINTFCHNFGAVIVVDNSVKLEGDYVINPCHLITDIDLKESISVINDLKPELVITFGGNNVPCMEVFINNYKTFKHWEINDDGEFRDPYFKLSRVFRCPSLVFFKRMNDLKDRDAGIPNKDNTINTDYLNNWKKHIKSEEGVPELYDYKFVVYQVIKNLPQGASVHIADSLKSSISSDCLLLNDGIKFIGNVCGNDIDCAVSSLMGQAEVSDEFSVLVIGELNFVYIMNSLWKKIPKRNIRIIFLHSEKSGMLSNQLVDGVNTEQSTSLESCVKSFGYRYLSAHTLVEFNDAMLEFYKHSESGTFLEVIFNPKNE